MNEVRIGDIADILNGYAFKSEGFNTQREGLPIVRIRDVVPGKSETYYSGEYPSAYVVQNGDLLIGMDGEFNIATWIGGKALLNQRVCKVIDKADKVDGNYLRFFLSIILKRIEAITPFVTVKHLSSEDLKDYIIPLPALPKQKRIATLLDKADRLRRSRRYVQELSDDFLQSVFLKMFGDPGTNPKGWNNKELQELVTPSRPITYGILKPGPDIRCGVPYIRVLDIQNRAIISNGIRKTSPQIAREYKRSKLQSGDLLLSIRGHVGRMAIVPDALSGANITQDTARLAPQEPSDAWFLLVVSQGYFEQLPGPSRARCNRQNDG